MYTLAILSRELAESTEVPNRSLNSKTMVLCIPCGLAMHILCSVELYATGQQARAAFGALVAVSLATMVINEHHYA